MLLAARYLAFIPFGLYRSIWRYAGSRDLVAIAGAVVVSEVVALGYMALTQSVRRLLALVLRRRRADLHGRDRRARGSPSARSIGGTRTLRDRTGRRTLIVGAGPHRPQPDARAARDGRASASLGFVDDNPRLRRRRVHGVAVLGGTHEIARDPRAHAPDIVLVTIPDAPRERLDASSRRAPTQASPAGSCGARSTSTRASSSAPSAE